MKRQVAPKLQWRKGVGFVLAVLALGLGSFRHAEAQTITVRVGDGSTTGVLPGGSVTLPVQVDMSAAGGLNLASLSFNVTWDPTRLSFVSATAGSFGSVTINQTNVASGTLQVSLFNATGATSSFDAVTITFQAGMTTGATTVAVQVTVAGNEAGQDISGSVTTQNLSLCVGQTGFWGDVTGDGNVNIIDAQQIARFSVGLPVGNPAQLQSNGDVTGDGNVNIIDAQQIARFSVGLAAAPRTGQPLPGCGPPPTQRTLTVTGTGTGTGTVTSAPAGINCTSTAGVVTGTCAVVFNDGTAVVLTATPAAGSSFLLWTGDCAGSGACNLTLNADKAADAQFDLTPVVQRTLTVLGFGAGNGTVTSNPAGINCTSTAGATSGICIATFDEGVPITLTATSAGSSSFQGWASAAGFPPTCSGPNPVCVVTLAADNFTFSSFQPTPAETFDIVIRFNPGTVPTMAQSNAFAAAEVRWESLMTNGLVDTPVSTPAGTCGPGSPALSETIDDVVILVTFAAIDGPGGVLASGGPCLTSVFDFLPRVGVMTFDIADLPGLEAGGSLSDIVLHEMGHVLGIGTLWPKFGLLGNPSLSGGLDPFFSGPLAITAFDMVGGATFMGNKVPVENTGGPGTADGHWRESVMDTELMTGFAEAPGTAMELSRVTVASLRDMGFEADETAADPYMLPMPAIVLDPRFKLQLVDDLYRGPIYLIGPQGTIVGEVRRRN